MRIVDNIAALRIHTSLTRTNRAIETSTLRLSSGYRINSSGDDPAGFAIALQLRNQVRTMNMADRNTLDGTSLLQTAESALQDVQNMIHRIRELAVQAANDTYGPFERGNIQMEIDQLLNEIDDVTQKVEFNNIRLLNGEVQNMRVQVGGRQHMSINVSIQPFTTYELFGLDRTDPTTYVEVDSHINAQTTIARADAALDIVSEQRAFLGAFINRFEYTSSSLRATVEATQRSLSRIQDADMAYEMMHLSTNNVLSQAAMAIMAQVNARPQQLLQLI